MPHTSRYIELDWLRSLAVLAMVVYHAAYDLVVFYQVPLHLENLPWVLLQRATASTFLLLVGCSFAISWSHTRSTERLRKYVRRGCIVLALGVVISLLTYAVDPETYVRFGILHLIGVSIFLLPFFARLGIWNLLLGAIVIVLGGSAATLHATSSLFLVLNIVPWSFSSVDFFPLLPWFGVVLVGYAVGKWAYIDHTEWRTHITFSNGAIAQVVAWPGRHALVLYVAHQPILILVLWAVLGRPF